MGVSLGLHGRFMAGCLLMLCLLLACFGSSPDPDAVTTRSSLDAGLAACQAESTPVAVGRCSLDVLRKADAVTMKACDQLPGTRWQTECVMEAVEGILNKRPINQEVVRQWREKAGDRQTVVFCSTVAHAKAVAEEFSYE